MGTVPANFKGVKGKSGRKSWDKEIQAKQLWELSIPVLKFALTSGKVDLHKKADIALALVNKMLPSELKGGGFSEGTTIIINRPTQEKCQS